MRPRARRWVEKFLEAVVVTGGVGLLALILARMDHRIEQATAQTKTDAAQDARLDEQDRRIVAIGRYMTWSADMLVGIAARVGATMSEAPPAPAADDREPGPQRGPAGR